jgi:hypothetical protein
MRVTSDLWISALIRRVQSSGGFAALVRRGFAQAGAIFITVHAGGGEFILFVPAAQTSYEEGGEEGRLFMEIMRTAHEQDVKARLDRETRFDPDAWIVELEIAGQEPTTYFTIKDG